VPELPMSRALVMENEKMLFLLLNDRTYYWGKTNYSIFSY